MYLFPSPVASARRTASVPSLARAFDHLFSYEGEARVPALDVSENDTAYTLTLDLPGLTKDQLKVSVQGRRVSIEAGSQKTQETGAQEAKDGDRVLYRERSASHYARTVSLPSEVDQSASSAKFENGVLTLTIAKKVPTGATQIAIS